MNEPPKKRKRIRQSSTTRRTERELFLDGVRTAPFGSAAAETVPVAGCK
jgi:hypothetical protein